MGSFVPQPVYSCTAYTPPSYILIISSAAKRMVSFCCELIFSSDNHALIFSINCRHLPYMWSGISHPTDRFLPRHCHHSLTLLDPQRRSKKNSELLLITNFLHWFLLAIFIINCCHLPNMQSGKSHPTDQFLPLHCHHSLALFKPQWSWKKNG